MPEGVDDGTGINQPGPMVMQAGRRLAVAPPQAGDCDPQGCEGCTGSKTDAVVLIGSQPARRFAHTAGRPGRREFSTSFHRKRGAARSVLQPRRHVTRNRALTGDRCRTRRPSTASPNPGAWRPSTRHWREAVDTSDSPRSRPRGSALGVCAECNRQSASLPAAHQARATGFAGVLLPVDLRALQSCRCAELHEHIE